MKTAIKEYHPGKTVTFCRLLLISLFVGATACSKDTTSAPAAATSPATASYRADVAVAWINLQLKITRTTPIVAANVFGRTFGYSGITGYEAVVPGMAGYKSLAGQLNGLVGVPVADKNQVYSWPVSANAALAAINRSIFTNASPANLATIDSLEAATKAGYQASLSPDIISRSVEFGQQVAAAVIAWAKTDGYDNTAAYTPPTGPGLWVPTPPAFGPPIFPHWGSRRTLVAGSGDGADPGPPMAYSDVAGSPFYLMGKEVCDIALTRTADQTAIALFWNDAANGHSFTPPGHWNSILAQVLVKENATLDKALYAYARLGLCLNDAAISVFKAKYTYNQLRPVSYARLTLGLPTWTPLIITPSHPEYSAAHATVSAAAAEALTEVFGPNYAFTDQNYVPFGLGARSYTSFEQAGAEAGMSRLYGGIHYRPSIEKGQMQGKKVAQNIDAKLVFK